MALLAYFITLRAYGTWLHGHQDGSVDRFNNELGELPLPPDPWREAGEYQSLKHAPVRFQSEHRWVIVETIQEVCRYRGWTVHALNVRTTHVHVIAEAPGTTPERVMNDLKAYCTRRLAENGVLERGTRVWAHHGSTRYLNTQDSLRLGIDYVLHQQGPALPMTRPRRWKGGE